MRRGSTDPMPSGESERSMKAVYIPTPCLCPLHMAELSTQCLQLLFVSVQLRPRRRASTRPLGLPVTQAIVQLQCIGERADDEACSQAKERKKKRTQIAPFGLRHSRDPNLGGCYSFGSPSLLICSKCARGGGRACLRQQSHERCVVAATRARAWCRTTANGTVYS